MFGAMNFLRGAKAFSPIKPRILTPRTALRRLGPGVRHTTEIIGSERDPARFLTSSARDGYRGYRDIPFVKSELSAGNARTAIQFDFPKKYRLPVIYADVGRLPIQQGEFIQNWFKETASEDGTVLERFVIIRSVWVAYGFRPYGASQRSMVEEWTKLEDLPVKDRIRVAINFHFALSSLALALYLAIYLACYLPFLALSLLKLSLLALKLALSLALGWQHGYKQKEKEGAFAAEISRRVEAETIGHSEANTESGVDI